MSYWETKIIYTARGHFEVFVKGEGNPICVTHHYSEFNHTGDYFADTFTENNMVYLVNLKQAGKSSKANEAHELSMFDAVYDLEAIREALGYSKWSFAGHSTGGMIGNPLWYSFFNVTYFTNNCRGSCEEICSFIL